MLPSAMIAVQAYINFFMFDILLNAYAESPRDAADTPPRFDDHPRFVRLRDVTLRFTVRASFALAETSSVSQAARIFSICLIIACELKILRTFVAPVLKSPGLALRRVA